MIDKILSIVGLVRKSTVRDLTTEPYSEDELDTLFLELANMRAVGFDKEKYNTMLDLLRKNSDFAQFLDWTIAEDVKRAFNVTDAERPIVRGAVSRTRYLRSLCIPDKGVQKELRKKITRYSSQQT